MNTPDLEKAIDALFAKNTVRIAAENPHGRFSSVWRFWAHNNDFYFSARTTANALKVSLHENGRGYLGYNKQYLLSKNANGFNIGDKIQHEWALPIPGPIGAKHAASVILPANYCYSESPRATAKSKVMIYGVESGCAVEIGLFLSYEDQATLESKLVNLGHPMVMFTLDNKLKVSIVVRSRDFDPSVLPSSEKTNLAKRTQLMKTEDLPFDSTLNAMLWNAPNDGEAIQVVDIGGVKIHAANKAA